MTQRNAALVSLLAAIAVILGTDWIAGRLLGPKVATPASLIAVRAAAERVRVAPERR